MRVLLIDNYDSFTYNLYQLLGEIGAEVRVARNDAVSLEDIEDMRPDRIVISPGPKTPAEAGISNDTVLRFAPRIPILGVCLGHQCIGVVWGGKIARAERVMHGKTSLIHHSGDSLFTGVPSPFRAARYHSLVIVSPPDCLRIIAETDDGVHMAFRHREYPAVGVQFHPESFLTEHGRRILSNFLRGPESSRDP